MEYKIWGFFVLYEICGLDVDQMSNFQKIVPILGKMTNLSVF